MSEAVSERDNLPRGWVVCKLENVTTNVNSGFASGKHNKSGNGIPHIRPMNINYFGNIDLSVVKYVQENFKDKLQKNDVLFNNTNSPKLLGKTALIKENTNWTYSNHMTRIRVNNSRIESSWLAIFLHKLFLDGFYRLIAKNHVNQSSINSVYLTTKIPIIIAPLNEQKRIVSKIESIFTQIDGARTRLEAASGMLNKLRSSVLRQAFEGRLVPQDPDDEPVEAILKRIRRASEKELVLEKDNLPNGWIASSVGQLYKIVGGGTPSTRVEKYWNGDISWISSADIRGLYDIRPRRKITPEAIKNSATNLVPAGSIIVVTRVGLGKIAKTNTPLCFSQDSQALIGNVSFVNPDYMLYYLSQAVQSFKHASRGTTISGVTKKQLSDLLLSVAPPNEQKRIVSKIESIFTRIDAVERYIESTLRLLDLLKSSTFKQAFEGRLVPQDPDDEPAEFLLQIMKQEKQLIKSQTSSYGRKNVR